MDGDTSGLLAPHRFTVAEYYAMAEAGILGRDCRVELIEGQIVDMSPVGTPHHRIVIRLNMLLTALVRGHADVSVQGPVRLNDLTEPEPDLTLIRPTDEAARPEPIVPRDVFLLIEVADSSLTYDRRVKARFYASNGIVEYWIVNLVDHLVEVHRRPAGDRYLDVTSVGSGELEIGALPGVAVAVAAMLPRRQG